MDRTCVLSVTSQSQCQRSTVCMVMIPAFQCAQTACRAANPTRSMRSRWQQEAHARCHMGLYDNLHSTRRLHVSLLPCFCRYGLSDEQEAAVEMQYAQLLQSVRKVGGQRTQNSAGARTNPYCMLTTSQGFAVQCAAHVADANGGERENKLALLGHLRTQLQQLLATGASAELAGQVDAAQAWCQLRE